VAIVVAGTAGWPGLVAQEDRAAPFADEIRAFGEWDAKNTPPPDPVLFVGSSSIRLWPTADRFPDLVVVNRGFGGSKIADVDRYLDRVVLPYHAGVIVFYAGDNDIGGGMTAEAVRDDYRRFVDRVLAAQPDTDIVFVAIKPSLQRWNLWPTMQAANGLIRDYSATRANLHYADIAAPMIRADGKPNPALFVEDGLHMTPAGYDIWTDVVGRIVRPLVRADRR